MWVASAGVQVRRPFPMGKIAETLNRQRIIKPLMPVTSHEQLAYISSLKIAMNLSSTPSKTSDASNAHT